MRSVLIILVFIFSQGIALADGPGGGPAPGYYGLDDDSRCCFKKFEITGSVECFEPDSDKFFGCEDGSILIRRCKEIPLCPQYNGSAGTNQERSKRNWALAALILVSSIIAICFEIIVKYNYPSLLKSIFIHFLCFSFGSLIISIPLFCFLLFIYPSFRWFLKATDILFTSGILAFAYSIFMLVREYSRARMNFKEKGDSELYIEIENIRSKIWPRSGKKA